MKISRMRIKIMIMNIIINKIQKTKERINIEIEIKMMGTIFESYVNVYIFN